MKFPASLKESICVFCQNLSIPAQQHDEALLAAKHYYDEVQTYRAQTAWEPRWEFPVDRIVFELMTVSVFAGEAHTTLLNIADLAAEMDPENICRFAGIPSTILTDILAYQEQLVQALLLKNDIDGVISSHT